MRRTKHDSEQTRRQILDAARAEFARRGVTRTSLEHIARAAGVTRGAIYWHFANKAELFQAMREQVTLPLVDRCELAVACGDGDPLDAVEAFMQGIAARILADPPTRATFEILTLKCEYVDELERELESQVERCTELLAELTAGYERARARGVLRADLAPDIAALESCAFLIGLFRIALVCTHRTPLSTRAAEVITAHVAGRRRR